MEHCYGAALYASERMGWKRIKCCDEESGKLLPIEVIHEKIKKTVADFLAKEE
jgi:hypothetical protein